MEAGSHDSIRSEEGFLDTIAMVAIDIDVKNTFVSLEELDDREDTVVYVTET